MLLDGRIYVAGGLGRNGDVNALEIYDPGKDKWLVGKPMPSHREAGGAAANGIFYLIGGYAGGGMSCAGHVEAYDPKANTWTTKDPIRGDIRSPTTLCGVFSVVAMDGLLYMAGGTEPTRHTNEGLYAYDPLTGNWRQGARMPIGRGNIALATYDHRLYIFGGVDNRSDLLSSVEAYDPKADAWDEKTQA